ncbi:EAL domain-containing protein [Paraburkholderia phytofirmans]|uniref:EAL domain-containing protein n=1 Tax=Paraburkholderia phytofirmans TaxID=261302 RepID=UPI0009ECF0FB
MSEISKSASLSLPAGASGPVPIWSGIGPRLSLLVATGGSALVLVAAVLFGEYGATRALAAHERLIGNDLVASVDRILNDVRARRRTELVALVGRPCGDVRRPLAQLQTYVRYVRGLNLVVDGRVYCSSGLGQIDVPLSVYVRSTATGTSINLLPQTPFHPGDPVLTMFDATGQGTGILYLIAGTYIADALAHGVRFSAQHVALSLAGVGLLTDNDGFVPVPKSAPSYTTNVTSGAWPFSITLSSSPEFASQLRWQYRLYSGAAGVLLDMLIITLYLLAFAPDRLLLNAVRRGLRQHEFHVVYQPIVDVASRYTVGVEALLRWDHPKKGPIGPSFFMAEVETSSLLAVVTGFVLRTAVAEMSRHAPTLPLRVAVNIAPGDLERKGFAAEVLAVSRTLPGGISLVLELTERFLLNESAHTMAAFRALKAGGVRFAIDDFGTHHSNLDLLSRFPFDYVKIDRQFVSQADTGGAGLIKAVVSVAHHFGLQVIAEGVETEEQHQALRAVGVSLGQGYLYQRPLRAEQLVRQKERR